MLRPRRRVLTDASGHGCRSGRTGWALCVGAGAKAPGAIACQGPSRSPRPC